jgi:DNA mismatch repair protein MutL
MSLISESPVKPSGLDFNQSQRILALESQVVDQIAAGEVLERPAHMVKELIENALDAGATEIELHLGEGGRSLTLIDNGRGFHPEDLKLALQRHTTSKLKTSEDIWNLSTYGFRGEALASISAVSHMNIRTHRKGQKCIELQSEFGEIKTLVDSSLDYGTQIEISKLYENTPARLKFLKTDATEVMEIKKVLWAFGLCQHYVSLKLFYRDHLEFFWPKADLNEDAEFNQSIISRNQNILGTKELYGFKKDFGDIKVEVHFAPPHETAKSNRKLWTFVQNRWVQEPMILAAIRDGFQNTLLPGEYPIGAIFIEVPNDFVDVNVHPTKSKVKFKDQSQVYRAVRHTLLDFVELSPWRNDFLSEFNSLNSQKINSYNKESTNIQKPVANSYSEYIHNVLDPNLVHEKKNYEQTNFELKAYRSSGSGSDYTKTNASDFKSSAVTSIEMTDNSDLASSYLSSHSSSQSSVRAHSANEGNTSGVDFNSNPSLSSNDATDKSTFWSNLLVIGQVGKTYLVTQNQNEIVYIDQHAAHERYLFEKLWQGFKQGHRLETQRHLLPLSFKVDDESFIEILIKHSDSLAQIGIVFEQSGPRQIEIIETPSAIKDAAVIKSLEKMMEQILSFSQSFVFEDVISDVFATMACHSAIRAGQILTLVEMEELLDLMDEYSTTSYCPHGRPVFVRYSFNQIEKDFCRKV